MAISIVNGFFCENSCDVAKAKKGEDPHPRTGSIVSNGTRANSPGISPLDRPAVTFGGSLSPTDSATAVASAAAPTSAAPAAERRLASAIDLLV